MADGTPKKTSPIAKILPILIAVPVLLAAVGGGAFLGMKVLAPPAASAMEDSREPAAKTEKKSAESEKGIGPMLMMKERVVNLAEGTPGGPKYLKFATSIEFKPEKPDYYKAKAEEKKKLQDEFIKEMVGPQALVEDTILMVVSSKKASELMTPEGREKLKLELIQRIDKVVKEPHVVNIYFTEFVMQ